MIHVHNFRLHIGLVPSFDGLAWVLPEFIAGQIGERPQMWVCTKCGEQGYAIPVEEGSE
jgi:hypothetical protein